MAKKKPRASKAKGYAKMSQKEKFIAAAKESGSDESGETFTKSLEKLLPMRPKKV
jgi:hypothetical protein